MILSSSPPPQPVPSIDGQPAAEDVTTTETDPNAASLKAIFPDFDKAVILSVLESTNYDHDRALDVLLGMNDPSFTPQLSQSQNNVGPKFVPSSTAQGFSQEALDEQLAKRLALEEEQLARHTWAPQSDGEAIYQAYQPRRGRNDWNGAPRGESQTAQGQGGRDTMAEFQEGFNRIAETGKKTFSSLMSKVRAKMQEFEQSQGWSGSLNSTQAGQPQPDSTSYPSPYTSGQPLGSGRYAPPSNLPRQAGSSGAVRISDTYTLSPPRLGVLHPVDPAVSTEPTHCANSHQASYYDPNTKGYDLYDDDEIQITDKTTSPSTQALAGASATPQNSGPAMPPQTDATTNPSSSPRSGSLSSFPSTTPPPFSRSSINPPVRSLSPVTASNAKPGAPGGVDFSKLGLLPKRPISLVRAQSPPIAGVDGPSVSAPRIAAAHSESTTTSSSKDGDVPEFVENPFEDQRP